MTAFSNADPPLGGAQRASAPPGSRQAVPPPPDWDGRRQVSSSSPARGAIALAALAWLLGAGLWAQEPAPDPVRQTLAAALQAIEAEDFAAAERSFARVTELDPGFAPAWLGLAEMRQRLGRPREALEAARRAQQVAPELAAAAFAVARSLAELGSHREALAAAERARELEPGSADVLLLSSLLLRELGR
ncbi:MAG TPA: tetratricopeptide repeat protein, partial [Thermoanaerobaculia bacterium]|nr:tetratricopeptide repeat protein [Thermoanaerobaculia bacterium]